MGDVRFHAPYRAVASASDRAQAIADLTDEDLVAALAQAAVQRDEYLVNVLATASMNRVRRLNVVLDNLGEGAYAIDAQMRVTYFNRSAERLLGWSRQDLLGRNVHEVIHARRPDGSPYPIGECPLVGVLEEGRPRVGRDEAFVHRDGSFLPVTCSSIPILEGGAVTGAVLVFHDATERRKREEREALRARASEILAETTDYQAALERVARLFVPTLADWCSIDTIEDGGTARRVVVAHQDPEKVRLVSDLQRRYPPRQGFRHGVDRAMRKGEPELVRVVTDEILQQAAHDEEHLAMLRALGLRSYMVVPLRAHGRVLGALTLVCAESGEEYDEADLRFAMELADRAALAVDHARLHSQLVASVARYDLVARSASEGYWDWDVKGGRVLYSARWKEALGYAPDAPLPETLDTWLQHIPAEDRETLQRYVQQLLESGETSYQVEHRFRRRDGSIVWHLSRGVLQRDAQGRPLRLVGFNTDVTRQKRLEEELRAQRDLYETLVTAQSDLGEGVVLSSGERILFANDAVLRLMGYSREEVLGAPSFLAFVAPEDRERMVARVRARARAEPLEDHYEVRLLRKDGAQRMVELSVKSVRDEVRPLVVTLVRDVTEQRAATGALRARERQQAAVARLGSAALERAPLARLMDDAVATLVEMLDVEYAKVLELRPGGERLLLKAGVGWREGLVGEASVGADLDSQAGFTLASDAPVIVRDLREETRFRGPPLLREYGVVSGMSVVIRGGERPYGVLGVHTTRLREFNQDDVAFLQNVANVLAGAIQRQRHEEELERRVTERTHELELRNKELEAFSYSVSHDLRAPLRGIGFFTQLLEEEAGPHLADEGRMHLARLRAESERLSRLVNDLLDLARVANAPLAKERVDVTATARLVVEDLARGDPSRRVDVALDAGLQAWADPQLLRVALENLLGNAWKFTRKAMRPRIHVGQAERDGRRWIVVEDNGVGFDPAKAERLFSAFSRLHKATEFEGTGVGLATVHRIVVRHGGEVRAEAKQGEGARFYVWLPEPDD